MADYRQIHTSIWDDDWFCQLSSDEKIVFVWLFSNRRASVSGIYKFTDFICSRETGIPLPDIKQAIQKLISDQKICIEGEWVWVKNLRKYNDSKSPNSYKRIASDLEQLPDNGMRKAYLAYYQGLDSPYQAPTKPLQGASNDLLEKEQEKEQEKEKEKDSDPYYSSNPLSVAFEKESNIQAPGTDPRKWIDACNKMTELGIIESDVKQATYQLIQKGYTVIGPSSVVNAAINVMTKRKQTGNGYIQTQSSGRRYPEMISHLPGEHDVLG